MKIVDLADMPHVVRFIYRQLDKIDTTLLEKFTMDRNQRSFIRNGYSKYVKGKYHIRCAVMKKPKFPYHGLRCRRCWGRVTPPRPCRTCKCKEYDEIRSVEELMVFLAGHEVWHFMVQTNQETSLYEEEEYDADEHGRDWLRRWRCGATNRRR